MKYRVRPIPTKDGLRFYLMDEFGNKNRGGFASLGKAKQKVDWLNDRLFEFSHPQARFGNKIANRKVSPTQADRLGASGTKVPKMPPSHSQPVRESPASSGRKGPRRWQAERSEDRAVMRGMSLRDS